MTVDTKAGTTYRGYCVETEDNMNVKLRNVLATGPTGEERPLDHVFIRGSQVNFVIFPDILKHSPMFERVLQRKQGRVVERGLGRARSAAIASKGTCNRASVHCRRFYRPKLAGVAVLCPPRQPLQPPQQQANTARSRRPSTLLHAQLLAETKAASEVALLEVPCLRSHPCTMLGGPGGGLPRLGPSMAPLPVLHPEHLRPLPRTARGPLQERAAAAPPLPRMPLLAVPPLGRCHQVPLTWGVRPCPAAWLVWRDRRGQRLWRGAGVDVAPLCRTGPSSSVARRGRRECRLN